MNPYPSKSLHAASQRMSAYMRWKTRDAASPRDCREVPHADALTPPAPLPRCSRVRRQWRRQDPHVLSRPVRTELDGPVLMDMANHQITRSSIGKVPSRRSVEPVTDTSGSIGYWLKLILPGSGSPRVTHPGLQCFYAGSSEMFREHIRHVPGSFHLM